MSDDEVLKKRLSKQGGACRPTNGALSRRRQARRERRVPVGGDIAVTFFPEEGEGRKKAKGTGRLLDLSRNGMRLAISFRKGSGVCVGDHLELAGLKTCLISALRGLQAEGIVEHKKKTGPNGTFTVGLALHRMSGIDRTKIDNAVRVLRRRAQAQGLYPRRKRRK